MGQGSLGRTVRARAAPSQGCQPLPSPSPQRGGRPVPAAVAGWAGGIRPLLVCTCGWEGGGPAPNYIKNISTLWLSLLQCPDFACLFPPRNNPVDRLKSRLACLSTSLALGRCPACPAWSTNSPAKHGVLPAAQAVCTPFPFMGAAEELVHAPSLPALAFLPQPSPACVLTVGGASSGFLFPQVGLG